MKSYETAFEEVAESHPVPPVIVGITDHEAGEHEEEIYRYMAVVQGRD